MSGGPRKATQSKEPLQSLDKPLLRVWTPEGRARCAGRRRSRNREGRGFAFNVLFCPVEPTLTAPWESAEGIEDIGWRLFFQVMNLNGWLSARVP